MDDPQNLGMEQVPVVRLPAQALPQSLVPGSAGDVETSWAYEEVMGFTRAFLLVMLQEAVVPSQHSGGTGRKRREVA